MREVRRIDDWERLRLAIRAELQAQYAIEDHPVDDQLLDVLAQAVATRIDYGFAFRWEPRWIKPGEPHRWTEGREHFVECLACGRTTAHPSDAEATDWYSDHRREHA
jgi:hypothetical protein